MDIFDAKALKLSEPMIKMISGAEIHEVRVNGEIVRRGYMIAGSINTVVALINRDVCTSNGVQHYGINWLTELGLVALTSLTGTEVPSMDDVPVYLNTTSEDHPTQSDMITEVETRINAREVAIEADNVRLAADDDDDDIPQTMPAEMTATVSTVDDGADGVTVHGWHCAACNLHSGSNWTVRALMIEDADKHYCHRYASVPVETNELPGDAERIWDAENAALEGADIRTEYEAEVADEERHAALVDELIAEIYADDRLMYLTSKGVFVSGEYVNTMRRIADVQRGNASGFALRRQHMIDDAPNLFALIDSVLEAGKITFGEADREKRRIRAHCRPSVLTGRKHKPSSRRRNRR